MALSTIGRNQLNTGIDDNSDATAITIDSSERVMMGTTTEGSAGADELTVGSTSGSNGITIRGGTTGSSSIYMSDATSGAGEYAGYIAYSHNSDSMAFGVSGGQKAVIDSSGKVGIGGTPTELLYLEANNPEFTMQAASDGGECAIYFKDDDGNKDGRITYRTDYAGQTDNYMSFYTNGSERMQLNDSGTVTFTEGDAITVINRVGTNVAGIKTGSGDDFCVGTADYPQAIRIKNNTGRVGISQVAPTTPFHVYQSAGDICTVQTGRTDTSNVGMIVFRDGDAQTCGQITSRGNDNTTSYSTSSDHRLKQSITDMTGAIDRLKALLPKRFSFVNDTTNTMQDGFLAHEAQTVVPQSVVGTHNETREVRNAVLLASGKLYAEDVTQEDWTANKGDGENDLYPSDSTWAASHTAPVYQQIDHSKLVPLLTGALQEAIAKIETLETKVAALESG